MNDHLSDEGFLSNVCYLIEKLRVLDIKNLFRQLPLDERTRLANLQYKDNPLLLTACKYSDLELIKFFIDECGADIEMKGVYVADSYDNSSHIVPPLWYATVCNKMDVVRLLLDRGANINSVTDSNSTCVRAACFNNNLILVKFLVERGADINIPNISGSTCLMNAVGSSELCQFLISKGANVNARSKNGMTALHYAVIRNNIESIEVILSNDGDIRLRNDDGYDALTLSALCSDLKVTKYFIDNIEIPLQDKINAYELLVAQSMDQYHPYDFSIGAKKIETYCKFLSEAIKLRLGNSIQIMNCRSSTLKPMLDNFTEPRTLEQLQSLCAKPLNWESYLLHATIIKDRILGSKDKNTMYSLIKYASIIRDSRRWKGIQLFEHALQNYVHNGEVLNEYCIYAASQILAEFRNLKNENMVRPTELLPPIGDFISLLDKQLRKATDKINRKESSLPKSGRYLELMGVCLELFFLICSLKSEAEFKFRHKMRSLLSTKARTTVKGSSFLHLVFDPQEVLQCSAFPDELQMDVLRYLIECGADVNALDNRKNTPLHAYISFSNITHNLDDDTVNLFLKHGAHIDTPNENGKTVLDLMKFHKIEIQELNYCNLQCLAARVIRKQKIKYSEGIPVALINFVSRH